MPNFIKLKKQLNKKVNLPPRLMNSLEMMGMFCCDGIVPHEYYGEVKEDDIGGPKDRYSSIRKREILSGIDIAILEDLYKENYDPKLKKQIDRIEAIYKMMKEGKHIDTQKEVKEDYKKEEKLYISLRHFKQIGVLREEFNEKIKDDFLKYIYKNYKKKMRDFWISEGFSKDDAGHFITNKKLPGGYSVDHKIDLSVVVHNDDGSVKYDKKQINGIGNLCIMRNDYHAMKTYMNDELKGLMKWGNSYVTDEFVVPKDNVIAMSPNSIVKCDSNDKDLKMTPNPKQDNPRDLQVGSGSAESIKKIPKKKTPKKKKTHKKDIKEEAKKKMRNIKAYLEQKGENHSDEEKKKQQDPKKKDGDRE
jgi:hypothetical protein